MYRKFTNPTVVISKCLEFEACRYNGQKKSFDPLTLMMPHIDFVPICPEVEIGLGTPRDPIRLVKKKNLTLIQPSTNKKLTLAMNQFSNSFLDNLETVDGFILKAKSPSCAIKDAKYFYKQDKEQSAGKGPGLFTKKVVKLFPCLAIEDEGRLRNFHLREHFLTKLFALSSFRNIKKINKISALIKYQADNKFLMMAYNEKLMRILGKVVASYDKSNLTKVFKLYEKNLHLVFEKPYKRKTNINVLMHAMGFFSKLLTKKEKKFILDLFQQYSDRRIPLSALIQVIRSWITRYENIYLENQTYFEPYPFELMDISNSEKREFVKILNTGEKNEVCSFS